MKQNILYLTDYIEDRPVVASVRYSELVKYMSRNFNISVCNNSTYGEHNSIFSMANSKFHTFEKDVTTLTPIFSERKSVQWEYLFRNPFTLKLWRSVKLSKTLFLRKNKENLKDIESYISDNQIDCILVTVPDIYTLYVMEYLKKRYPSIPVVVEIRDILNHSIGKGNPERTYVRAEQLILQNTNRIIALTEGIKKHYTQLAGNNNIDIQLIKNGFDYEKFLDCEFDNRIQEKNTLTFSHIGSIYKGRNIGDLIKALEEFSDKSGKEIIFNIVGVLDQEAVSDIDNGKINRVKINILGTKPHDEAIEMLKESDISVILTHNSGSEYAIPGKTFEYIGACKPILAISEDRELVDLIEPNYGEAANHNVESILEKLPQLLLKNYNFSDRKKYSREFQADKISKCLIDAINEVSKGV